MGIELGHVYEDKVTGFRGTATTVAVYLTGEERVELTSINKQTGLPADAWFSAKGVIKIEPVSGR